MKCCPLKDCTEKSDSWNPATKASNDEIVYIDIAAIDKDIKKITSPSYILGKDAPSRARQIIKTGDVLVSTVRPNLNSVALVTEDFNNATASTGYTVIRPLPDKLDSNYLFHWVKTSQFISEMVQQSSGASYPAVSDKIVLNSEIPLPPLPEQRRIAAILDKADELRQKRRQAIEKLDQLLQATFIDMFGDPVKNDKHWAADLSLGEAADIVSGITKGRKLSNQQTRSIPYLAVANVQDKFLNMGVVKVIDATEEEISKYTLKKGDLLLTEGGDPDKLGRGTLWDNQLAECIHQNHVFRVRLNSSRLTPYFLNWLVGSQRGKSYFLRSAKQTTGIASINMTQLRGFPLLIPPLDLQLQFEQRNHKIELLKQQHKSSLVEIDNLFASLQQRAFSGNL